MRHGASVGPQHCSIVSWKPRPYRGFTVLCCADSAGAGTDGLHFKAAFAMCGCSIAVISPTDVGPFGICCLSARGLWRREVVLWLGSVVCVWTYVHDCSWCKLLDERCLSVHAWLRRRWCGQAATTVSAPASGACRFAVASYWAAAAGCRAACQGHRRTPCQRGLQMPQLALTKTQLPGRLSYACMATMQFQCMPGHLL